MKTNILYFIFAIIVFGNCEQPPKVEMNQSVPEKQVSTVVSTPDTIINEYPIQIGNDKALVKISNWNSGNKTTVEERHFMIELTEKNGQILSIAVDKSILFKKTEMPESTVDLIENLNIQEITYHGIRSNTLYFMMRVENLETNQSIPGQFNLFYRTKKRGEIYGVYLNTIGWLK